MRQSAADRALQYLEALRRRAVAPSPEAIATLRGFDEALPEACGDPADTLAQLDRLGSQATMGMEGPRPRRP